MEAALVRASQRMVLGRSETVVFDRQGLAGTIGGCVGGAAELEIDHSNNEKNR